MTTLEDIRKQEYETPEGVWVKDGAPPPGIAPLEQPETGLADPSEVAPQKQFQTPEQMGMQTYPQLATPPSTTSGTNHYLEDIAREAKYESPSELGFQEYKPPAPLPPLTESEKQNHYIVDNRKLQERGELPEYDAQTRFALNAASSFYTGTTNGASYLYSLKNNIDDPTRDPKDREDDRKKYNIIMNSLRNFERMNSFDGPLEAIIALGGQVAGSIPTAESLIPGGAIGARIATRLVTAGLTQAGINIATDPITQALSIKTGTQEGFSWERLGTSAGLGGLIGGGLQGVAEVAGKAFGKPPTPPVSEAKPEARPAETPASETTGAPTKAAEVAPSDKPPLVAEAGVTQPGREAEPPAVKQEVAERAVPTEVAERAVPTEVRALPTEAEMAVHIADEAKHVDDVRLDAAIDDPALLAVGETARPLLVESTRPATPETAELSSLGLTPETQKHYDRYVAGRGQAKERSFWDKVAIAGKEKKILTALEAEGVPLTKEDGQFVARAARFVEDGIEPDPLKAYDMAVSEDIRQTAHLESIGAGVGADIQFRTKAQAAFQPGVEIGTGPQAPNSRQVISLQEQGQKLADAIGAVFHQGRLQGRGTIGQLSQGVVRVQSVADVATIAHEAGHFIEAKLGKPLTDMTVKHAAELSSFGNKTVAENYAEFVNWYVTAPGWAERNAPNFLKEFDAFLAGHRDIQDALLGARQAFDDYGNAPTGAALDAFVKTVSPETVLTKLKKDGIYPTVRNVTRNMYTALMDRRAPIHFAMRGMARMIRDSSGVLPDIRGHDNPALLAKQFDGGMATANAALTDGNKRFGTNTREGPAYTDAISLAVGAPKWLGKWDEARVKLFDNYLTARQIEYLWRLSEANKSPHKPRLMSHQEAIDIMAKLEAENPTFRQASDMMHEYSNQQWRRAFEAGITTREQYDAHVADEFYVPMFRVMDERAGDGGHGAGSQEFVKHRAGTSERDVIAPTQGIIMKTFMLERKIAHNEIVKSLERLGQHAREAGAVNVGTIVENIPMTEVVGTNFDLAKGIRAAASKHGLSKTDAEFLVSTASDMFGDDPMLGTMFHHKPTQARGEPVAFLLDGGKERAVRLATGADKSGLALYEAITALSEPLRAKYFDLAINAGQAVSNLVRAGVTSEPTYALSNIARDQFMATFLARGFYPIYSTARGIIHDIRQTDIAKMYAESGGISPGTASYNLKEVAKNDLASLAREGWVVKRLGALDDLMHGRFSKVTSGVFRAYINTLALAETGTRIAIFESAFKRGKKLGLSHYDAMWEAAATARDVTDFGRHGSMMETTTKLLEFLNSWSQGLEKGLWRAPILPFVRVAAEGLSKSGFTHPAIAAMGPVTKAEREEVGNAGIMVGKFAFSMLAGYVFYQMSSDKPLVRDRKPETRAQNVILDGAWIGLPGLVLHWPKPFELALFWNFGEAMAQMEEGDGRWYDQAMEGVLGLLAPPNLIPAIARIPIELATGKSVFTEREIVPTGTTERLQKESEASSLSKMLSEAIGRTGFEVSPLSVDYAIGAQFGTWGRDFLSASNAVNPNDPENSWDKSVFFKRWIKTEFGGNSAVTEQFWEMASERTGTFTEANGKYNYYLQHEEDRDKALKYVGALPENQRVYVQLSSEGTEAGKLKYKPSDRQLHPLARARDACEAIKDTIVELRENKQEAPLDPGQRRQLISELEHLQGVEQRNALVILQEPGFTKRPLVSVDDQFDVISKISPTTGDDLARRYGTNRVIKTELLAEVWPEVKTRVMEGDRAAVRTLGNEARAEGYQFSNAGDVRVKAPKPLHVPIGEAMAPLEASP